MSINLCASLVSMSNNHIKITYRACIFFLYNTCFSKYLSSFPSVKTWGYPVSAEMIFGTPLLIVLNLRIIRNFIYSTNRQLLECLIAVLETWMTYTRRSRVFSGILCSWNGVICCYDSKETQKLLSIYFIKQPRFFSSS